MCFSSIYLFRLHTLLIFVLFLFLLVSGFAAACVCSTSWAFVNVFANIVTTNQHNPRMEKKTFTDLANYLLIKTKFAG